MKFGVIPLDEAEGAMLAHSVRHGGGMFKKGRMLSAEDRTALAASGAETVFAARLGVGDVPEDEAASAVARAIAGGGTEVHEPFTGRANLHSAHHGLAVVDHERVRALNRVHESLTLATAAPFERVEAFQMVATVKVIPFAVDAGVLDRVLAVAHGEPLIRVAAFKPRKAGLVITRLPQTKASIASKSSEAIRQRLEALDGTLAEIVETPHDIDAVARAIAGLHGAGRNPILVFGASAIVDRGDVIPAALTRAGGDVVHLGMPVDPGNLLMFGRLDGVPVIGVPSCARSPKLNGFDWVLARVMAGLHVSATDIMDMGAGGLLQEIALRGTPREAGKAKRAPRIAAVILAAGRSTRMGGRNKLLIEIDGKPMIRHAAQQALASKASPVILVTGHESERLEAALEGLAVRFVHNPDYAHGLSTSLRAGLAAVPDASDGAAIVLGDMPFIEARHLDKLIAAFDPAEHRSICVPVAEGRPGNPVVWDKRYFSEISGLSGDTGAKSLLAKYASETAEIPLGSAVHLDLDTPSALEDAGLSKAMT